MVSKSDFEICRSEPDILQFTFVTINQINYIRTGARKPFSNGVSSTVSVKA